MDMPRTPRRPTPGQLALAEALAKGEAALGSGIETITFDAPGVGESTNWRRPSRMGALARTVDRIADPPDASTAQKVALLYASDERCREHARRIAIAEARRTAGVELTKPLVDVESRARGAELHLSLNVEASRSSFASASTVERRNP